MPKSKHWFRTNAVTKDFLCLGIKLVWNDLIPETLLISNFIFNFIEHAYIGDTLKNPEKSLAEHWSWKIAHLIFIYCVLCQTGSLQDCLLYTVSCQNSWLFREGGGLIITHLVLAEVANAFNETRNLCILPLLLFFNDSTFNESRISAFPPTETNRVPMAQQTRIDGQDTLLILIRDH